MARLAFLVVLCVASGIDAAEDPLTNRWTFDDGMEIETSGNAEVSTGLLSAPLYPAFPADNRVLTLRSPSWLRVPDQPGSSRFDFDNGDEMTLEAWVRLRTMGENVYLIGKGRTERSGKKAINQNWALRLRKNNGVPCLNFLFRSRHTEEHPGDWHRWTSTSGLTEGSQWHHVAVSYTFGDPKSIRGFVDGRQVKGRWDMGGPTTRPPVIDDDDVWVGSSMAGLKNNSLDGAIDEVAIHRTIVPAEELISRFAWNPPPIEAPEIPPGQVVVQMFGPLTSHSSIPRVSGQLLTQWNQQAMGFVRPPHRYDSSGNRDDWGSTVLIRAWMDLELPPGDYEFLARSRGMSRLLIDGEELLSTPSQKNYSSAHHKVSQLPAIAIAGMRPHAMSDNERVVSFHSDGQIHHVRYDILVGGPNYRLEFGETCLAIASPGSMFHLLASDVVYPLTDDGWRGFVQEQTAALTQLDRVTRQHHNQQSAGYWAKRHEHAKNILATDSQVSSIDEAIRQSHASEDQDAASTELDDYAFLRRVFIDSVGVPPNAAEIELFMNEPRSVRRRLLVDRLLADHRWADNWVGYWQDVLAENPNLLKPTLNNTGPFRYWIHEALVDNKSADRFATELIMMRGSTWLGGPAGFGIASQNDVPMAAKAHVIGSAFLGIELKCARCHDAPFHSWKQRDLFEMAAMLSRSPLKLPESSTVPAAFFKQHERESLIEVSLKPGEHIAAQFPFVDISTTADPGLMQDPDDLREQLAVRVTSSRRFAEVIANRLWKRLMGAGLIEPADDWAAGEVADPELLAVLTDTLIHSEYDMKRFAGLIFNSKAYQQAIRSDDQVGDEVVPRRRRMSSEQIVDSAFHAVGKRMDTECLTMDLEGTLPASRFLNFGYPQRAWEFTTLANERDRPSLALPRAQAIVDVLKAFGWRTARPDPLTDREESPNLIQPGVLANGTLGIWLVRLTDESELTHLMLEDQSVDQLIDALYFRLLTRRPNAEERVQFRALLSQDYDSRVVPEAEIPPRPTSHRHRYVSWSNHLNSEANVIKMQMQDEVRRGPPPTRYLQFDWRERAEDAVWTLLNSPEMIFIP